MKTKIFLIMAGILFITHNIIILAQTETTLNDKLVVLWTSDDPYVAERVALMYKE